MGSLLALERLPRQKEFAIEARMEFGKLSARELEQVDFTLPMEDPTSLDVKGSSGSVQLGCPVWGQAKWVGKIYPEGTRPAEYLKHYAQSYSSIELNTTFYRIPDPKLVTKWKNDTEPGFLFCPKVFRGISQLEDLKAIPELVHHFCESIRFFEDRLGLSFLQLPPHLGPNNLLLLEKLFSLFPPGFKLAIEFRNPAWFDSHRLIPQAHDLLSRFHFSSVITDVAGRRDVLHQTLTGPRVLVRFIGNALHPSDGLRIEQWTPRIAEWKKRGVQIFFFIHQPEEEGCIELIEKARLLFDPKASKLEGHHEGH